MQDSLVAASAEFQGEIFFGFDEFAVYEGVDAIEHLIRVFGVDFSAGDEIYIIEVSGVAPDIFLRVAFFDLLQESCEFFLVLWLEGFAAEEGKSLDICRFECFEDLCFYFFGVWIAVIEIPGFGIEASFAVMSASGYKKADPDAGSICDIVIFDCSVIHIFILSFFSSWQDYSAVHSYSSYNYSKSRPKINYYCPPVKHDSNHSGGLLTPPNAVISAATI